jgi:hypothetical protein
MSMSLPNEPPRPWYREIWPWLLMLPPAFSVAGGVTMLYLASHTPSALVVDDYARIEELTNERFERDRRAAELGVEAAVTFTGTPARVEVTLAGADPSSVPPMLLLSARHATNPAADRIVTLTPVGGRFTALTGFPPGHYRIELMPADRSWRLGHDAIRLAGTFDLRPQAEPGRSPTVRD